SSAVAVAALRPAAVPSTFVLTPAGWFHPDCIRPATERGLAHAACAHPHYDRAGFAVGPRFDWAYVMDADAVVPNIADDSEEFITGDVRVPALPASQSGQVLYVFNGLVPSRTDSQILQPVLGFYGSGSWYMQNWDCCVDGTVFNDDSVDVAPG